jgi:hypothetical protein
VSYEEQLRIFDKKAYGEESMSASALNIDKGKALDIFHCVQVMLYNLSALVKHNSRHSSKDL